MKNSPKINQYDEFLHKIQQLKMKELWDNEEDGAWEMSCSQTNKNREKSSREKAGIYALVR